MKKMTETNLRDFLKYSDHEINTFDTADNIWDSNEIGIEKKIELSIALIDIKPDYSIFSRIKWNYESFSLSNKKWYWETVIKFLKSGNKIAKEAIEYSLYVDFFEDNSTVEEVWNLLFGYNDENVDQSLMKVCGPVPFNLKKELYYKYIRYKNWHELIFESLRQSFLGPYGNLDVQNGLNILNRLKIKNTEVYSEFKNHLEKSIQKK
jgi:hypothetical protein